MDWLEEGECRGGERDRFLPGAGRPWAGGRGGGLGLLHVQPHELCVCLSVCPSVCLFAYRSTYLSIYLSTFLSI